MAYARHREPSPLPEAMALQRFDRIFGTTRIKTTTMTEQWTQTQPIGADQRHKQMNGQPLHRGRRRKSLSKSSRTTDASASRAIALVDFAKRSTRSNAGSSARRSRKISRTMRLQRLRVTASAALRLGITSPKRADPAAAGEKCRSSNSPRSTRRLPKTSLYSAVRSRRCARQKRNSLATAQSRRRLDAKAMTALGAARANDSATTLGTHANEETMGAFAAHDGRLVSTFHGGSLRRKGKRAIVYFPDYPVKADSTLSGRHHDVP